MRQFPTTIIIFGITGDLARKKILPALYDLWQSGRLPDTRIVGFSRKSFSEIEIRQYVAEVLGEKILADFFDLITYVEGQFDDPSAYNRLSQYLAGEDEANGGCSNKLFYLSVPPTLYEVIATNLSASGLSVPCGGEDGFSRILIEKPFGKDLNTAIDLDTLLGKLFQESQIYRIDHYLAKDSLWKIINLHRKNPALESKWNKESILKVEINLFEKALVGSRGASYDGVGALRDVGQNHMLQMLALTAMDVSALTASDDIRKARATVLDSLVIPASGEVSIRTGQYEGYLSEPGVEMNSLTETYFSMTVFLKMDKFAGVPFVLSSGKALSKNLTEIIVRFKDGSKIIFDVPPEDSMPAYEKILLDCIAGDQTVFISTPEILAEWRYITPIILALQNKKPFTYAKGSDPENM